MSSSRFAKGSGRPYVSEQRLDRAAIGADSLAVYPAAFRTGEKHNRFRNVLWASESTERNHTCDVRDQFLRLSIQEQIGFDRAGRDCIHRNPPRPQLLGKHMGERLDPGLGCSIQSVAGLIESHHA